MDDALYSKVINIAAAVLTGAAILIAGALKAGPDGKLVAETSPVRDCHELSAAECRPAPAFAAAGDFIVVVR